MKFKTCPFCKFRVPEKSKVCPVCNHKYSKFEYFRMNYVKYVFFLIILLYIVYSIFKVVMINKQIKNFIDEEPSDIQQIESLEKQYDSLNKIQKYFVDTSGMEDAKDNFENHLEKQYVTEKLITVYFEKGSKEGIYTGEIADEQPVGYGTFVYRNEEGIQCVYEGEFAENTFNGNGTLTKETGEVYSGVYMNGMLNGQGQYFNENGELIYEGMFVNDYLTGDGTMYTPNGFKMYSGEFVKGIPEENNYKYECINVSAEQLYNDMATYTQKNISITGVVTNISMINDNTIIQYVISPQNGNGNDVCVRYIGNNININLGNTVTMYGYCSDPEDYYIESGELRNGIILQAFHAEVISS